MMSHDLMHRVAVAVMLAGLWGTAQAQTVRQPDVAHGAAIVANGIGNATPCSQCHGGPDMPDSGGIFPRLSGQSARYLSEQLHDFIIGARTNDLMTPIAKELSPTDIADVTAYYAGLKTEPAQVPKPDKALVERGERLAKFGKAETDLPGCNNCHGPGGKGEPPAIPFLTGQYPDYIAGELQQWQSGDRRNSADVMSIIAKKLDKQDIAALAAYFHEAADRAP